MLQKAWKGTVSLLSKPATTQKSRSYVPVLQVAQRGLTVSPETLRDTPQIVFHRFFHSLWKTQRTLQGLAAPLDKPQNTCYDVFMKLRNLKNRENPKNQKTQKLEI